MQGRLNHQDTNAQIFELLQQRKSIFDFVPALKNRRVIEHSISKPPENVAAAGSRRDGRGQN